MFNKQYKNMQSADKNIQWYKSRFEAFEQGLNGEKSKPVHALRRNAFRIFSENGFPTTRQEEWRFTNISPITKIEFQPVLNFEANGISKADIKEYTVAGAARAVFINGMFSKELSDTGMLPDNVIIGNIANVLEEDTGTVQPYIDRMASAPENAFTALNTAFLRDGVFMLVPKNTIIERPVQLIFLASDSKYAYAAQPRNIITVESDSRCKIIETYIGLAGNTYLTNTVTEILLHENSHLEHNKLQVESLNAFHIGTARIIMHARSNYTSNVFSLGGSLVRNNIDVVMDAESSECTLNGLTLGTGTQVIDNHTAVDHAKPNCSSRELYKSILGSESRGVFNGKIIVRKNAQKTDAQQANRTLLLSDNAVMNTKPQLEIFADDVKCTHGAAIGQLDDEQIFYLRSRGIGLDAARDILTLAFAGDVINKITIEPLRFQVEKIVFNSLDNSKARQKRKTVSV
ncbi:MAG: Fe-S cluster assembly protein SufD [Bacteroidetes bacterium]|nr:Fe-S cluster assembly protein SufD [Bacteroidota bacterium]